MTPPHRVGIDLGGTKTEVVLLGPDGSELLRRRTPTRQDLGYDHILSVIHGLYREAVDACRGAPHTLGIGIPGSLSPATGLVRNANTTCLIGRPLKADLERLLGHAVAVENDANCFALAEALHGAGRGHRLVFGVILGTGCGGGIVLDGRIHHGRNAIAGEWGHMTIDPNGPPCYCGQRGCVETYISGGGLRNLYAQASGTPLDPPDIFRLHRQGDPVATRVVDLFFEKFGTALANLLAVLDPDIVVVGGGLSHIPELYTRGVEELRRRVFSDVLTTPVVPNRLGDSAGVLGAAALGVP